MTETATTWLPPTRHRHWRAPIQNRNYVGARWAIYWATETMNEPAVVRAYSDPDCVRVEERTCPRHARREWQDPETGMWSCADCDEEQTRVYAACGEDRRRAAQQTLPDYNDMAAEAEEEEADQVLARQAFLARYLGDD